VPGSLARLGDLQLPTELYHPRYGRGILCTRFEIHPESAPVVLRFTRGADSCDPASPNFNRTVSATTLEGGAGLDGPGDRVP
jgi:hypothetical protein